MHKIVHLENIVHCPRPYNIYIYRYLQPFYYYLYTTTICLACPVRVLSFLLQPDLYSQNIIMIKAYTLFAIVSISICNYNNNGPDVVIQLRFIVSSSNAENNNMYLLIKSNEKSMNTSDIDNKYFHHFTDKTDVNLLFYWKLAKKFPRNNWFENTIFSEFRARLRFTFFESAVVLIIKSKRYIIPVQTSWQTNGLSNILLKNTRTH